MLVFPDARECSVSCFRATFILDWNRKLWSTASKFVILPTGEVQGCIPHLGNGTGGHHERCSKSRGRKNHRARTPAAEIPRYRLSFQLAESHLPDGVRLSDCAFAR